MREYDRSMNAWRRRGAAAAGFALLTLLAELTGRSLTLRLDGVAHVQPLAPPSSGGYPFLLAGVRTLAALLLAAVAWRLLRAHATAAAGRRFLTALGHHTPRPSPRLRLRLSPRLWLASFAATSIWFLAQDDFGRLAGGRWPLLAPWLHTYALGVFAVLSALLAVGWAAVRDWLADVEQYAAWTFARAGRLLRLASPPVARRRPADHHGPRRLFGLAFESRPPPLAV
jgi:hypothetical protein